MTPENILSIIEAFFNAVLRVLAAFGIEIKKDEEETTA